jgi:hypothetical protein
VDRSLAVITREDLRRLDALAEADERALFARHPGGAGRYDGRLICRALCQGAGLHFVDGSNGVKDFDVWSFYAALASAPFPYRRIGNADFGPSKFGRWSGDDPLRFVGRRIDFIGRSLPVPLSIDPAVMLQNYLSIGSTASAKALSAKAVVLVSPANRAGEVVWPLR